MERIDLFKIFFISFSIIIALTITAIIFSIFTIIPFKEAISSLTSQEMIFSFKLTIFTSSISAILVLLVSLPVGYSLARYDFFGKTLIKTISDLPLAFPQLVLGFCLVILLGNNGALGNFFSKLGISFEFNKIGIITAQFFTALPFTIKIIRSTFEQISPNYEFISRSLGYSQLETFLRVSLPLAKKGILAGAIISFARSMGSFGAVLMLAGGTRMKTDILPISLYLNFSYGNLNMAISAGMLIILFSFFIIYFLEIIKVKL